MATGTSRWPQGYQAAVSITLDNMGEAADLYRGSWPEDRTVGLHYSVTDALPRVLEIFSDHDLHGTYFIEGWNTGVYPGAIQAVRNAGHEVALHGWQHEPWASLSADDERELIHRSLRGFRRLNLTISGFRPPGGALTENSVKILEGAGIPYCSPAGEDAAIMDGMVYLPFAWQSIDAYYYSEAFGRLRALKGDSEAPLAPRNFAERVSEIIDRRLSCGGYVAILFHPHLETEPEQIEAMEQIIDRVQQDDRIWCAPCREVADWILGHPDEFAGDPELDTTTWSR